MHLLRAYNVILTRLQRRLDKRLLTSYQLKAVSGQKLSFNRGSSDLWKSSSSMSLKPRVVVSMTTTPGRISLLGPVLDSLAQQTLPPSCVYVNVPTWSKRFNSTYVIPQELLARAPQVIVNRCDLDYGPLTKLVPTLMLETNPNTLIVTVDDEYFYPPQLLAELVAQHLRTPHAALGFAGQQVMGLLYKREN